MIYVLKTLVGRKHLRRGNLARWVPRGTRYESFGCFDGQLAKERVYRMERQGQLRGRTPSIKNLTVPSLVELCIWAINLIKHKSFQI